MSTLHRVLRLVHLVGLALFVGSILTFIVASVLSKDASLADLAFARRLISTGTATLTLSGLYVAALSGAWLGFARHGLASRFVRIKALLAGLILVDALVFVAPAVRAATEAAVASVAAGALDARYADAYLRESVAGALNLLLALAAAIVAVWRIGVARPRG